MSHSALLPTQNHAVLALNVLPGNPHAAVHAVMLHNVSRDDALKITALVDKHGFSPLVWEPALSTNPTVTETAPAPDVAVEEPSEKPESPT